ncbi:MAG: CadD family cadmium resistance transporter [Finegoldia sp.]|nr:CadD family cadmium resistance transporter [Finegoldia sp.]
MELLISAILVFISTSIDYLVILTILFAIEEKRKLGSIYAGQYLGTGLLVLISLIAAYFLNFIPKDWMIGFLGLIPLGLGIRAIFVDEDVDEEDIEKKTGGHGSKILEIASLTIAMGGDNLGIYIPYFTGKSLSQILIIVGIFALGILALCKLSQRLSSIASVGEIIEKYEKIIVPVVFIGLGLYIIIENGTISYLLSLIRG